MDIEIKNFLGCKTANIELPAGALLAVVGGLNEAGKSSIALAVAAALTDSPVPFAEVTLKTSAELVNDDAKFGSIFVRDDNGTVNVDYPGGKKIPEGAPPEISRVAAGLDIFAKLPKKERADELIKLIGANPDRADIADAIKIADKDLDLLVKKLATVGWEKAHSDAVERGRQLKAKWEQATGASFKPVDGANWKPTAWDYDLDKANEDDLVAAVATANAELEKALKTEAISAAKMSEIQELACGLDAAVEAEKKARSNRQAAQKIADAARSLRDKSLTAETSQPCPSCDCALTVDREGKIQKYTGEKTTPEDLKKFQLGAEVAEKRLKDAQKAEFDAESQVKKCRDAFDQMTKLADAPLKEEIDLQSFRDKQAKAESRLRCFKAKREADQIFATFKTNQDLIALLAPDGLRQKKLAAKLSDFNKYLCGLASVAGWRNIEVRDDMSIRYGGRPYYRVNTAGKKAVDVLFQVAFAAKDSAALIIVDEGSVLDSKRRPGLLKMLLHAKQRALVCATMDSPEQLPKLGRHGRAYWMEEGVLKTVEALTAVS